VHLARLLSFVLAASLLIPTAAPQTAASQQAVQYLQRALAALSGGTPLNDVTLSGTAHRIAGSDSETGTAALKAVVGASRMDLNLSLGPRSEVVNRSSATPGGTWSGPDRVSHPISYHNLLLIDPAWFFPAFPISRGALAGYIASYVGHETRDGQAVEHLTISQTSAARSPRGAAQIAHLSQMDFFLDSTTFLPVAATFNIHPDDNASLDVPIEVRFSDYHAVNGAQVPFHVQKFLNNGLVLDLQFATAAVNTGLAASQFRVGE
jgi:hypothetical protein